MRSPKTNPKQKTYFFTARKADEESKAIHPQILKRYNSRKKKKSSDTAWPRCVPHK